MKISINKLYSGLFLLLILILSASCSDWNDIEAVDIDPQHAKDQNPELWARYMESLRVYKQERTHYITYGSFDNSTEQPKNEGAYFRSVPDSLDIVTLDKAVATATELKLDGFAFNGLPSYGGTDAEQAARKEAARLIVSKLSAFGKTLVFEGDPAFVDAADLSKLDYVVLNTTDIENAVNLKLHVVNILETYALSKEKLLLAAKIGGKLTDEDLNKLDAVTEMTNRVISLGPLGGLAIYALGDDYYQAKMNYQTSRMAIQTMNPSK